MILSKLTHQGPNTGVIRYWIARCVLTLAGWDVTGALPPEKKFVLIGAHHTSNWDFPIGILATYVFRIKSCFMAKDSLFRWPLGFFMRLTGGMPVDRASPHGVVGQMVNQFKNSESLVIGIAPSGTRSKADGWRSGFYHIAYMADVPIVCGYLDYKKKIAHISLTIMPSGNINQDMNKIRDFYARVHARYPDKVTPVRLNDEDRTLTKSN